MQEIVNLIKKKKELSGLADTVIKEALENYLRKNRINLSGINEPQKKIIVKEIRAELRKYSGRFHIALKKADENDIRLILKSHSSTRERLDFYPELKKVIKSLEVSSVLDLGCGLNPLALATPEIEYYALDINEDVVNIINSYFERKRIKGRAIVYDIRKIKPSFSADLCLLLKILDVIETRGHKFAEKIINSIQARYFLISFSTKTLSGKPMNHPQRGWIERLLQRLGFKFKVIKSKNEIFYLAEKHQAL